MAQQRGRILFAIVALIALLLPPLPAWAQQAPQLSYIRDAEIEYDIRTMVTPLMRAASLDPDAVNFVLIQDNNVNAFVAGGMNLFIYTGLLQYTDNPSQLVGVIAHELGHIAGGHLVRGTEAMRNASTGAILGMIAGLAAGILSKNAQAGMGALGGAQELAARNFFSFSRAQEGTADAAGMHFLDDAGFSSRGMLEFMRKLKGQEYMPNDRQEEFVRTHPLTQDRVNAIAEHVEHSPLTSKKLPAEYDDMHARIKAKLLGFLQPENALLRFTDRDPRLTARYARAIALYRTNRLDKALALTDTLIREEPDNPFFHELRGQMLYENSRIPESIAAYRRSVTLLPASALLQAAFGNALLQSNAAADLDESVTHLQESVRIEPHTPSTWRSLATAWGRKAEIGGDKIYRGMATYALAEEALAHDAPDEAQKTGGTSIQIAAAELALLGAGAGYPLG
ncbi:MAG: M48 family metalloprotease [Alphaproteobacteria bacterium]